MRDFTSPAASGVAPDSSALLPARLYLASKVQQLINSETSDTEPPPAWLNDLKQKLNDYKTSHPAVTDEPTITAGVLEALNQDELVSLAINLQSKEIAAEFENLRRKYPTAKDLPAGVPDELRVAYTRMLKGAPRLEGRIATDTSLPADQLAVFREDQEFLGVLQKVVKSLDGFSKPDEAHVLSAATAKARFNASQRTQLAMQISPFSIGRRNPIINIYVTIATIMVFDFNRLLRSVFARLGFSPSPTATLNQHQIAELEDRGISADAIQQAIDVSYNQFKSPDANAIIAKLLLGDPSSFIEAYNRLNLGNPITSLLFENYGGMLLRVQTPKELSAPPHTSPPAPGAATSVGSLSVSSHQAARLTPASDEGSHRDFLAEGPTGRTSAKPGEGTTLEP